MLLIGECVHHVQSRRGRGELFEHLLRERADDDGVHPALEVPRDVGHRLAPAERDVTLHGDDVPAELADGDLERRPRAQRRLVEEHRDMASVERFGGRRAAPERPVRLHARGEVQAELEIDGIEIEDGEKVFAGHRCGRVGRHYLLCAGAPPPAPVAARQRSPR